MNGAEKGCKSDKAIFWQGRIDAWKASALSQQEYCRQNNLALATFGYWRRKLKNAAPKPRFYPLALPPKIADLNEDHLHGGLQLMLGNNRFTIEIGNDFSPNALQRLVQALEQL